jgi:acyl-CoA reductase-like NAD-dependent aldehyde dehydrogenase
MDLEREVIGRQDLLVAGHRVPSRSGKEFTVADPSSGRELARVSEAGHEDVDAAIDAALDAFERGVWSGRSPAARGKVLGDAAALLHERRDAFARVECENVGKPIRQAYDDVDAAEEVLRFYSGAADKFFGQVVPVRDPGIDVTLREPIGVAGLIVPWNFPLMLATFKIAPALACGNSVLLKPASYTPLTALMLGELLVEAGVPEPCISVLPGPGGTVGAAIARDPRVRKISFTGETATGKQILHMVADNIGRVSLELGGKAACVVFADADLDRCIESTLWAAFTNAGQDCCARCRLVVDAAIYDDFVARFSERVAGICVGEPLDWATEMGPMISGGQRTSVEGYVQSGIEDGVEVVVGGSRPGAAGLQDGFYLEPTVLAHATPRMRVSQEEIFGPVVVAIPFHGEEEAVAIVNDVPYGLATSVWTSNLGRGIRMAKAIRVGVLSVNSNHSVHLEAPVGGYKQSGLGRELGMYAMETFTEVKNVFLSSE